MPLPPGIRLAPGTQLDVKWEAWPTGWRRGVVSAAWFEGAGNDRCTLHRIRFEQLALRPDAIDQFDHDLSQVETRFPVSAASEVFGIEELLLNIHEHLLSRDTQALHTGCRDIEPYDIQAVATSTTRAQPVCCDSIQAVCRDIQALQHTGASSSQPPVRTGWGAGARKARGGLHARGPSHVRGRYMHMHMHLRMPGRPGEDSGRVGRSCENRSAEHGHSQWRRVRSPHCGTRHFAQAVRQS